MQLQIRHAGFDENKNPQFEVAYAEDGRQGPKVVLTPPCEVPVANRSMSLKEGLHWYLEKYLDIVDEPYRNVAADVTNTLDSWGKECFDRLFGSGRPRDWYQAARQNGLQNLNIKIASDDPEILSWPWEALTSGDDGHLALQCRMERRLDNIPEPVIPPNQGQADRLNILYIIARPFGDSDAGYSVLARPLTDFVREQKLPVHIDVLRPPTFDRLREVLREKPGFYHIVHFDGHGGYGAHAAQQNAPGLTVRAERFAAPTGVLLFEEEGTPANEKNPGEAITAEVLGELLREHNIPIMVLNACQSAMIDGRAENPFASVAANMLKAGVRSVAAMSYSLYVSAAKEFVPAFYKRLFTTGNVAESIRAGRQEMYRHSKRSCFTGQEPLQDWVVPVLYQQFAAGTESLPVLTPGGAQEDGLTLPSEVNSLDIFGFIGRDREIQALEKAMRRPQGAVLIHGMAGEGKTTLAKGFLQWLQATHGLGNGAFWFSFEDIHSAGYVIDTLANALFGTQAMALKTDEKITLLTKALREHQFILVWDNFESASGIPGTEASALMPEEDRQLLKQLLHGLRKGKTKVLITSRSQEAWLAQEECFRVMLEGLNGEELWSYCNAVAENLGLTLKRDEVYRKLMEKLDGNPLAVRAILSRLHTASASTLLQELEDSFNGLEGDGGTTRIQAALAVFEKGLDRRFAPVLRLLGLHEHYADADYISLMMRGEEYEEALPLVNDCFAALENAGLCRPIGSNTYHTHPALRGCLARLYPAEEDLCWAFVNIMGQLANAYAPKELHEQRPLYDYHSTNLYRALRLAHELGLQTEAEAMALTQGMAEYARQSRNFSEAERLFSELAESTKLCNDLEGESSVLHQLGLVAEERRDFATAESWYKKSLVIKLKQGNEHGAAKTYHQLGSIALEMRDFRAAKNWYKKALAIELKHSDEHGAASTYHQLGRVAEERKDFNAAEDWCGKSLAIELKHENEYGAAITYNQLGMVAVKKGDLDRAEDWYGKALTIELRQSNEQGAAITYHQLGMIAEERKDFNAAEDWYGKALIIKLKLGNEYSSAITYHQLGMVAQERGDADTAAKLYKMAFEIFEKYHDDYSANIARNNLNKLINP